MSLFSVTLICVTEFISYDSFQGPRGPIVAISEPTPGPRGFQGEPGDRGAPGIPGECAIKHCFLQIRILIRIQSKSSTRPILIFFPNPASDLD